MWMGTFKGNAAKTGAMLTQAATKPFMSQLPRP